MFNDKNTYKMRRKTKIVISIFCLIIFIAIASTLTCKTEDNFYQSNTSGSEYNIGASKILAVNNSEEISKIPYTIAKNDYKNRIQINQERRRSGGVPLTVIMYHNIVSDRCKENDYEVRVSTLERDLKYLSDNGYTSLNTQSLAKVVSGEMSGGKYVMLTFDDGFYSYLKYLPQLLEKYDMHAIASVVGQFSANQIVRNPRPRCSYMTYSEVQELSLCDRIEIACHTDNLHSMKSRRGVRIKDGESEYEYKQMLTNDTIKSQQNLDKLMIKPTCYTYPYGEYCKESEEVVRGLGYNMTLTCYEHVNYITSDTESMYLLGRYNRTSSYAGMHEIFNK